MNDIDKLAYKIYISSIDNEPGLFAHEDWFVEYKDSYYKEFYDKANIKLRKKKIEKIINEHK